MVFTPTGTCKLERDTKNILYDRDIYRDAAAINKVLDREAAAQPDEHGKIAGLLRAVDVKVQGLLDKKLIDMCHFAKDKFQRDVDWRACLAHTDRLERLNLRMPQVEFDRLALELNPLYGATEGSPVVEASTQPQAVSTAHSQNGVTPQPQSEATGSPQNAVLAPSQNRVNAQPQYEDQRVPTIESTRAAKVPAKTEGPRRPFTVPPQDTSQLFERNTETKTLLPPALYRTRSPAQPAALLSNRGHMPSLKNNEIDPALIDPALAQAPHRSSTSIQSLTKPQQANVSSPTLSNSTPNISRTNTPYRVHNDPHLQTTTPVTSPAPLPRLLDPIFDPKAAFRSAQQQHNRTANIQPAPQPPVQQPFQISYAQNEYYRQQQQTQVHPARKEHIPQPQQPLSVQAIRSYATSTQPDSNINPAWVTWNADREREARLEAERKARIRSEIISEIAAGADVLAYRLRDYNDVMPNLSPCERNCQYHSQLLANKVVAQNDVSEEARVVRFAREKWWNYWMWKDFDMAKEAMGRAEAVKEEERMECWRREMRGHGHLVTLDDLNAIRADA
jgi:hypothetical protein